MCRRAETAANGSAASVTPPLASATGASRITPAKVATAVAVSLSRAPASRTFHVAWSTAAPSASAKAESGTSRSSAPRRLVVKRLLHGLRLGSLDVRLLLVLLLLL